MDSVKCPFCPRLFLLTVTCLLVVGFVTAASADSCECGNSQVHAGGLPWLAGIARKSKQRVFCWGSLINERYVLTVGHCVASGKRANASLNEIWLNDGTTSMLEPPDKNLIYDVEEIKLYPKYNLHNDIALIKLKNPVSVDTAFPVCLPSKNDTTFSGNGTTIEVGSRRPDGRVMLVINHVPIHSNADCVNGSKYKNIKETMVCGGDLSGRNSSCAGDSGNPLLIMEDGRAVLMGLASWGRDCSGNPGPAVYARVSAFTQWITENTRDADQCTRARA